jgi:hypothetical protein
MTNLIWRRWMDHCFFLTFLGERQRRTQRSTLRKDFLDEPLDPHSNALSSWVAGEAREHFLLARNTHTLQISNSRVAAPRHEMCAAVIFAFQLLNCSQEKKQVNSVWKKLGRRTSDFDLKFVRTGRNEEKDCQIYITANRWYVATSRMDRFTSAFNLTSRPW